MILPRIAFRSILRQRGRSVLVVVAITLGTGVSVFLSGITAGMIQQGVDRAVGLDLGHIQIRRDDYAKRPRPERTFSWEAVEAAARNTPGLVGLAPRLEGWALAVAEEESRGVQVLGVDPRREQEATRMATRVRQGRWLQAPGEALAGYKLARLLGLGIGDELILLTSTANGGTGTLVLKLVGTLAAGNPIADQSLVLIPMADARVGFEIPSGIHRVLARCAAAPDADMVSAMLDAQLRAAGLSDQVRALSWKLVAPTAAAVVEMANAFMLIITLVLQAILALTVIGAVLTSVHERRRQFAVLAALGLKPRRLVSLVLMEVLLLVGAGGALGFAAGAAVISATSATGIDMSAGGGAETMRFGQLNIENVVHPVLPDSLVLTTLLGTLVLALLVSLWPAIRVARTDASAAMRR